MIEIYKIINSVEKLNMGLLFVILHNTRLSGNTRKIL